MTQLLSLCSQLIFHAEQHVNEFERSLRVGDEPVIGARDFVPQPRGRLVPFVRLQEEQLLGLRCESKGA